MRLLVLYATIEGQTGKVAHFVERKLSEAGHTVELVDIGDATASVSLEGFDKIILAASVHELRHPKPFEVFLAANRIALAEFPTLLISVSLKAAFPEGLEEAGEYVTEMEMRTGFTAGTVLLVAGAVHPASYDYFASQILRHVVLRGRDLDPTQEQEFTDWDALERSLATFIAS